MSRKVWIPIAALAALVLLGAGGAYAYFFSGLRSSPSTLALASPSASTAAVGSPASGGTWSITTGSLVGYRVKEQFVGQSSQHEAVARTSDVTGQVTITRSGSTYEMTSATVTVQLSSLTSVDSVARYNVTWGKMDLRDWCATRMIAAFASSRLLNLTATCTGCSESP